MVDNLSKKIFAGYFWNLASKWINRSIGVVSSLILIRILEPSDFGIAALATIVMTLFIMLSDAGAEKYAIKAEECTDELLNSAWSLNIALKLACSIVIALLAGPIATFTHEPVLQQVLLVSALIPIIGAFKNIGLVFYHRDLNYQPLTQLAVLVKIAVFPVTIGLALIWKNYWALVVGLLVNEVFTVVLSYRIHPYRPAWSIKQWRTQWSFSQWVLLSTTTGYVRSRIDAILLGRFLPSDAVGVYRVSQEFAWLPFSELISPATSSFYAGISKISQNRDELQDKILQYLAVAYLLVIPSAIGIYSLQDQFVAVIMGDRWSSAAPILGLLSLLMLSMPLNIALQTALTSLSKLSYLFYLDLIMIVAVLVGFSWLYQYGYQELLVYTKIRVTLVVLFIVLLLIIYKVVLGVGLNRLLQVTMMPLFPGLAMFFVLEKLKPLLNFPQYLSLILLVIAGVAVFIPLMFIVIRMTKRVSPEYDYIHGLMFHIIKKVQGRVSG